MVYVVYLVLYGFALTAAIGLAASWIDRKVTARVQYRVGPPVLQPLLDIVKLLGKDTLLPEGASKAVFFTAPLIGFSSVVVTSTLLWMNNANYANTFIGDLIVAVYLLTVPSLAIIIGGFASANPLASIGASREIKLVLGYELPFIMVVFVPVIKSGFSIRLGEILAFQSQNGAVAMNYSGALAFTVAVLCMQAKLGLVPFDVSEAETEITGGTLIEYSGSALAIYKLMKNMLFFVLPFFLIILFMGGLKFDGVNFFYSVLKYVGLVAIVTVIRNTNPRARIDQAVKFFWGPVTVAALTAIILAFKGL